MTTNGTPYADLNVIVEALPVEEYWDDNTGDFVSPDPIYNIFFTAQAEIVNEICTTMGTNPSHAITHLEGSGFPAGSKTGSITATNKTLTRHIAALASAAKAGGYTLFVTQA